MLLLLACAARQGPAPTAPDASTAPDTSTAPSASVAPADVPLGGQGLGFVEASSSNGRLVLVRRWEEGVRPSFGHHGDTMPWPELVLLDFIDGTEQVIDEVLEVGPQRRWMLVQVSGEIWLLDSQTGEHHTLEDIDITPDGNACLLPRAAHFAAGTAIVGWLSAGGGALNSWDLQTGARWQVPAEGRLWRGWPDATGRGAVLLEVAADSEGWPLQNTSCACLWCNRFALSYGVYGWSGPAFTITHVDEDGTRTEGTPPETALSWHGPRADGCTLTPTALDDPLDQGPWQWRCSE